MSPSTTATGARKTDWEAYYARPFVLARLTRSYTACTLTRLIRRYTPGGAPVGVVELGGGDSAFLDAVSRGLPVAWYLAIDRNLFGLRRLAGRTLGPPGLRLVCTDVLQWLPRAGADVTFSVGLIEHFTPEGTRAAILAHTDCTRRGGLLILTFPTPTPLYRLTRRAAEVLGLWRFPDERPLATGEVAAVASQVGDILHQTVLWPLVLTQAVLVVRVR